MMKSLVYPIILLILISTNLYSQEQTGDQEMQTLIDLKKMKIGYQGSVGVGFSKFYNKSIVTVSGNGGMIINHHLYLGFGGKGVVNMPKYPNIDEFYGTGVLEGGYGGVIVEPILFSNKIVHFSFPVTIGGGALFYMTERRYTHINNNGDEVMRRRTISQDEFFILEPGINIELNFTNFMRVCVGATYRWVPGLNLQETPTDAFNGITGEITFKFGKF